VNPTDHAAFGAAVRSLVDDPARREAMGEAAHRHVLEYFLPDTQIERWILLLDALL
jgi:glycosyltransferase involved in cell wall biosynthesis